MNAELLKDEAALSRRDADCVHALSGLPDPKATRSLERGERRYRRKVASPKRWQAIIDAKLGPCRVCVLPGLNGGIGAHAPYPISFHHLVSRSLGGDDVADNIVPLCGSGTDGCHGQVERRFAPALFTLAESLTDAERAYVVAKLGEGGMERLFGV